MKTHYTAKELAGLPGLPTTERAIQIMADRESWPFRKRSGRGGGKEYALAALPAETRQHLTRQAIKNAPVAVSTTLTPVPLPDGEGRHLVATTSSQLKQWQREIMEARVAIMRLIERAASVVGVNNAINTIVKDSINNSALHIYTAANARKGSSRHLSYSGVIKWWMAWKLDRNCMVLAPKDTENYLEPAWAKAFMECWSKPQKPCLTEVLDEYYRRTKSKEPSYSQARLYLQKMGVVDREKGRKTGNELKAIKTFRRRDTSEMFPGDAYTADGHCFDAEVAHPFHGRPFRPEITPVLDVFSRKLVGWSVDLAESGLAVLDALRSACETHGVPAIFYTDNGSGYKNQMMTAPGTGILNRLAITPEYSRPRNPQAHGLSERGHQTILIKAAQQLCTYIGSKMDGDAAQQVFKKTRKAISSGGKSDLLIEWDDFIAFINASIEKYNNTPHRGLPATRDPITRKKTHLTPNQAWQMGLERMQRELAQEEWLVPANELPDLYHPAIERTIIKGEIQFGTLSNGLPKRYFSHDLEEWHGSKVQVAYSPSDASRVWVRDLEHQRLLAVAKLAGNSDHYFAPTHLEEARIKRGKGRIKRLELKAEEAKLEMYGPQPVMAENPDREKLELVRKQIEEADLIQATVFVLPRDERDRHYKWQDLDEKLQAGQELSAEEASFYRGWQTSGYFRSWQEINKRDQELATPGL